MWASWSCYHQWNHLLSPTHHQWVPVFLTRSGITDRTSCTTKFSHLCFYSYRYPFSLPPSLFLSFLPFLLSSSFLASLLPLFLIIEEVKLQFFSVKLFHHLSPTLSYNDAQTLLLQNLSTQWRDKTSIFQICIVKITKIDQVELGWQCSTTCGSVEIWDRVDGGTTAELHGFTIDIQDRSTFPYFKWYHQTVEQWFLYWK